VYGDARQDAVVSSVVISGNISCFVMVNVFHVCDFTTCTVYHFSFAFCRHLAQCVNVLFVRYLS